MPSGDNPGAVANNAMERQLRLPFVDDSAPELLNLRADGSAFYIQSRLAEWGLEQILCGGRDNPHHGAALRMLRGLQSHITEVLIADSLEDISRCESARFLAMVVRTLLAKGWTEQQSHQPSQPRS